MRLRYKCLCGLVFLLPAWTQSGAEHGAASLQEQTRLLLDALREPVPAATVTADEVRHAPLNLSIRGCGSYPYNEPRQPRVAAQILLDDLRQGLQTGLSCIAGLGPPGNLHDFHRRQARRLVELLSTPQQKTFLCVEDAMFATAVATSPKGTDSDDALLAQLRQVDHPGVIIDTFRLGGFLSRQHDDQTYRTFFHLDDSQIYEHRNAQPLRPKGLHRYSNRASLLFHELVHWLGHEHSATQPDLAHLYETCCFGGSDYISDESRNLVHQLTACRILRDEELWSQSGNPYRQMRLWHYKGYHRLKPAMRDDYDS